MSVAGSEETEEGSYWVEEFLSEDGNEFFCEVDEDFILDRFNLTGLNSEVTHFALAFDVITDGLEEDLTPSIRNEVIRSARHLYGLIHARYIITARGFGKMEEMYRGAEFGRCPRFLCEGQAVLPVGLSDRPGLKCVHIYCPRCEDVYLPRSKRHQSVDGAYFGTSFPHLFFQVYQNLQPSKPVQRYIPKVFGFKVHCYAKEQRRQDELRNEMMQRLRSGSA
ncbi:casein kinase II beta subunit [Gaertneriomyces semiglobifer]|nr:casein kinase II beta subunit [Gaertneriomyces semiglobifer]